MTASGQRQRLGLIVIVILLIASAGARWWRIDQKNIWLDEAVSWDTATRPLTDLIKQTEGDIHPPLYYMLLKFWMPLAGTSLAAMRSLSAILGVLAILLSAVLGQRFLERRPLAIALAWLAISPHMIAYAQEARMYAAVMVVALALAYAYMRWWQSGFASRRALLAFTLLAATALYLHYFTMFLLAAFWAHLALVRFTGRAASTRPDGRTLAWWFAANLLAVAIYAPWLPTAARQISHGQPWRQPVTFLQLPEHFGNFFKGVAMGPHYGAAGWLLVAGIAISVVVIAGWLVVIWNALRRQDASLDRFLVVLCGVPLMLALVAMPATGHMQLSRYLAYLWPLIVIGAARGLWSVRRFERTVTVLLVVPIVGSAVWTAAYFGDAIKDSDLRPISAYVLQQSPPAGASPRAIVLAEPNYMNLCVAYDLRDVPVTYPYVPADAEVSTVIDGAIAQAQGVPVWFMIEKRWRFFSNFSPTDPRLVEVDVPGLRPQQARLFRVRP